ncbi:MAG: hypothetical protein ACRD0K_08125 [Egibacteraceae bacterium]
MHTGPEILPLYIANGVTGIREMLGLPHHHDWRARIASGEMLGPRMIIASRLVDGPGSFWAGFPGRSSRSPTRPAVAMPCARLCGRAPTS